MRLMDLSAYRALWQTPGVFALLASALLARLPVMAALVPVSFLAKDAAGNFGSVGMAVGGPIWSRLADRRGGRGVVIGTGVAWGVAMAVLALLPNDWYRLMPLVSALAGAVVPPVTATLRAA